MTTETFLQRYRSDTAFAGLLDEVREYAQVYILSKERRKGCNGMSLHVVLTEEFKDAVDNLSSYCREMNYPAPVFGEYDLAAIAAMFSEEIPGVPLERAT